ncbi:uncharacterized protein LOC129787486 isoform X2 [Lutzomyia longipalpis]|uniref:Uncharacterized protein n=1 Tax=Lutzomyia longipalpis TaxID=7200 RepID=A0A1B0CK65_LUTLO|nr:uncharacterized protein LOC129787486 isoform X2 [Lutzomyia longipalpis]
MGTFVHGYDHPVLWSEEKRRLEQRKIADESLQVVKQRKEQQFRQKIQEKEQYKRMIEKHYPWGKPGGGAPNDNIRMTNITRMGLFPEAINTVRNYVPPPPMPKIRGGGGGAPIRSNSGRVITTFRDDPSITFKDQTRNIVDIELRYKTTPKMKKTYKQELDKIVAEKARRKQENCACDKNGVDPWGKAGPGGAPWRPPNAIGCSFMESMGWTDTKLLQKMDSETHAAYTNPSLKVRASPPSTEEVKHIKEEARKPHPSCCLMCNCLCVKDGKNRHPPPPPPPPPPPLNNPVPRRIRRECDKLTPKVTETKPKNPKQKKNGKDTRTRSYMVSGGVELVPLLAKRRAQERSISLSSTDVTKYREARQWENYSIQYLNDLCRQMDRKQKATEKSKRMDMETSRQHYETWSSFWGRPGHGAPRDIKNKLNLDDLLYKVPLLNKAN